MSNPLSPAWQRFKKAPRLLRYSTYVLSAYALYAVILGAVAPAVIKAQAPDILSKQLGRNVNIRQISINPFLLRARVEDFAIKEANGADTFTGFDALELEVNFWQSLFTLTTTIEHLTLQAPQVALLRLNSNEEARFNFSDILETLASQASTETIAPAEQKSSGAIPAIRVQHLEIANGQFHFHDNITGAELNYAALNLKLNNFDSHAGTLSSDNTTSSAKDDQTPALTNHYSLMIEGADQGQLDLDGQFQLAPFKIEGTVKLQAVTLPPFWPFTADQMQASITDGSVNVSANYSASEDAQGFHYQIRDGQLQLDQLVINDQNKAKIKLPKLAVNNVRLDGDTQQVNIDTIDMQGLWVDGEMSPQGLDLAQLFTPKTTATEQDAPQTEQDDQHTTPDWLVNLNRFAMSGTDINIKENIQSEGVWWRISPLSVTTGAISSNLDKVIDYDINMSISSSVTGAPEQARGQLSTQGQLDPTTLTTTGKVAINKLDLSQVQPYLKPYVNLHLTQGHLSTQGQYHADTEGKATFQGSAAITDLLVKDTLQHQPLIKWHNMSIDSMQFDAQNKSLNINTVAFDAPYAKVMIARDKRTNIGDILVSDGSNTQKTPQTGNPVQPGTGTTPAQSNKDKPFAVNITAMTFANGSAYFADNSLTPNFASGIEQLHGSIRNLSSTPGTKAQVDIAGKIDKYAPVSLKGEINPLIPNPYLDLNLVFKSVELTSVNPYSGTYAGYYIDKGQLSLTLNYQLEENKLAGDNHLVIDQLQLGKPSESELATSLPVSLAIAILQDKDGVIDLGVQVSGDVNDPDFSFGSVILKALSNVIVKAVTAPFSLLANLVGSDEELDHVTFEFGHASLSADEQLRLDKLATGLESRPQLTLSIAASVSEGDDRRALAEQQVQQHILQRSGLGALPVPFSASRIVSSDPLTDAVESLAETQLNLDLDDERDKVVQQLTAQTSETPPSEEQIDTTLLIGLYNQLVNAVNISSTQLENLAEQRAKAIKAYLVDQAMVAPERVFLLDSKTRLRTEDSGAELSLDAK